MTTTPTGAPTTTPTRIVLPSAATAHTEDGAGAFATFYVQQIDISARDAKTDVIRALVDPSCGGCNSVIRLVESLKSKSEHHSALSFRIAGSYITPYSTHDVVVIDVLIDDTGATTVDAAGRPIAKSPSAKFTLRNSLEWRDSGWIVTRSVLL